MDRESNGPDQPPWKDTRLYQRGLAAFEAGRWAEAVELLSRIADERGLPGTLARFYLGRARMQMGIDAFRSGDYGPARRHLTAARSLNPESAGLARYLGACYGAEGRFDLMACELERPQAKSPDDQTLPIRLAHALLRDGQRDRAIETLESAIGEQPDRADLRFQLGVILASTDAYEEAVRILTEAVDLAPGDEAIRRHLGLALGALNRPIEAVEHLTVAQQLAPHDAYAALLLTVAVESAEAAGARLHIVTVGAEAPENAVSIETLGDLIIQEPDFVEAFLALPESEIDTQIFAMLAATLERALERHPEYADLHHHCSRVYARQGRTDEAIRAARRAVDINPRYVQALIQLGRLYADTNAGAEAIERLNAAIGAGGDYPDVHFMLGRLYGRSGDSRQACIEYVRALKRNGGYHQARRALRDLVAV